MPEDDKGGAGEIEDESERQWLDRNPINDGYIRSAKRELLKFFVDRPEDVFFGRQLQVLFEDRSYHWITSRALGELADERQIQSEYLPLVLTPRADVDLGEGVRLRFFFSKKLESWKRKARTKAKLVRVFGACDYGCSRKSS